ncbi:MAG: hypothetical protein ACLP8A_11380 [Methylovirgula sp.]
MRNISAPLYMIRLARGALLSAAILLTIPEQGAQAEPDTPVSAVAFAANPAQYLNKHIRVPGFACYAADKGYRCASGKKLDVIAATITANAAKKAIDEGCGQLDGIERTPGCIFDLNLVPAAVSKAQGTVVKNGEATTGEIWVVEASGVTAVAAR